MIKFKYSLTLAFEKYSIWLVWVFAIAACSIVDEFNHLFVEHRLYYYTVNTVALIFGWILGAWLCSSFGLWMRENTIWYSEWEAAYGSEKALCDRKPIRLIRYGSAVLYYLFKIVIVIIARLFIVGVILFAIGALLVDWLGVYQSIK